MNIFEDVIHHRHHDQEQTVTQQQQPARLVDSLHAMTGEIQANPLVARLLEHGLGKQLTAAEADHFAALIYSLEQSRVQPIPQLPDSTSQLPPFPQFTPADGGTQQQPVQQP